MAEKTSLWESAYNRLTGKVNKHDNNQFVTPIEKKELITASSKEELEDKKLEYQQTQYLYKQHSHIIQQNDMQAVQANALRLPAYVEYKMMESYPIIAQALNVLAEEATTIGDRGQMLNIYSNNNRLKEDLEYLFYEILDINTNLPFWVRNTPIRENSMIPLLDGTECTIKELSDRIKLGEEIWSYSIQDKTHAIVPSKIVWCDLTRKNSELYRVTLDDGTYIDTTPDHEYMLRNGSFKRADELTPGQSLMPYYTKKSNKKQDQIGGYEKVFNPSTGKYKFTHRMVAHECVRDLEYEKTVNERFDTHHIDFNKLNNHPHNLQRLTNSEHFKIHTDLCKQVLHSPEITKKRLEGIHKYLTSDARRQRMSKEMTGIYPKYFNEYNNSDLHSEHNEIRTKKMLENWSNEEFVAKTKKGMTIEISDSCLNYITNIIASNENYVGINKLAQLLKIDTEFINLFKETYTLRKDIIKSINHATLTNVLKRKTELNYFDYVLSIKPTLILDKDYIRAKAIFLGKTKVVNHKVVSVVKLEETSDVYCLEAVGPNGEHDRHNFPVLGKDINGSYSRTSGVFLSNCKFGDNFLFVMTEADKGVVNVKQLPTSEIERQEKIINGKPTTKFIWQLGGQEYTNFQVAHFRLLGDENTLPYGTSVLAPVRMYYRMLKMSEDAQLVYRATNAARVKVVKVPTGNMDPADIPMFMRQTISNFKKSQIVDPATGQINYKYSPASGVEDIFVAVKNAGDPSPIDILEGADNLDKIADIEYLRDNLFTGLGVPKNRLNFSGSGEGGGDNNAQTDIVFSRKVMRIQNAMIQELNKIALIHLFLLGYSDDDIRDYKLTLNNPSTQSEILKIEAFTQKVDLYVKLTTSNETGLKPMSETNAKKLIFGLSADEILDDIKQQMIENVVGDEIKNAGLILKKSGIFNDLEEYIKRGIITSSLDPAQVNGEQPAEPGADAMGGPMDAGNNPAGGAAPQGEQEPFQLKEKYLYRANKTNNELVQLLKEVEDKTSLSQNSNETVQLLNEFLNNNNKL
jgi:intein/homing endonuclease